RKSSVIVFSTNTDTSADLTSTLPLPPALGSVFFFYCYRAHRYLHSFPTRRSSDLAERTVAINSAAGMPWPIASAITNATVSGPRSEEHTSELQSQSNLVCRLLLEKKKTQAR